MTRWPALLVSLAIFGLLAEGASAQSVRILGRNQKDAFNGFTVGWPGSGFEAKFTGKELSATIADDGGNWFNVEVDGKLTRLDLLSSEHTYPLFSGASGDQCRRLA